MYNASSTLPIASTPTLPTDPTRMTDTSQAANGSASKNSLKRSLDDGDSPDVIEPKSRLRQWVLALPRSERKRIKALQHIDGRYGLKDWCEMSRGWQGRGRVRSTSQFCLFVTPITSSHPHICLCPRRHSCSKRSTSTNWKPAVHVYSCYTSGKRFGVSHRTCGESPWPTGRSFRRP